MSTRAVIGVYTDRPLDKWRGTYHHWDGYPTGLGQALWRLYHEHYDGLLAAMLEMLIDAHPHGWSTIVDADWSQRPTWIENTSEWYQTGRPLPPLSYRYRYAFNEQPFLFNEVTDGGQEWAYVFDLESDTMTILQRIPPWEDVVYVRIETLPLNGSEPDWNDFE